MRTVRVLIVGLVLGLLIFASSSLTNSHRLQASAHDAHMPSGAAHSALEETDWVMHHWAPFDEAKLRSLVKLSSSQLEAFLYDDHHTIAQLLRKDGIKFGYAIKQLASWAPASQRTEIRKRIREVLTGGHLAQHLLFHVFHGEIEYTALWKASGLEGPDFDNKYRRLGVKPSDFLTSSTTTKEQLKVNLQQAILNDQSTAVSTFQTPQTQADRMTARKEKLLGCWLERPYQPKDSTSPYGRRFLWHGKHTLKSMPITIKQQTIEERAIEINRAKMQTSCWPIPVKWRGEAGQPLSLKERRKLLKP